MLEALTFLGQGFINCLTVTNILCCIVGVLVGTLAGVLPGLGISGSVAILLPITYSMEPLTALIMVSGIYFGSQYGGAITSILVNIPGEATSIVTCFDGYPMAKKGLGGKALGISAVSSFCGGTVGLIFLTLAAPQLARLAVSFGAPEFFAIVCFGLLLLTNISGKNVLKATIMVFCGVMLGCVGLDSTFGSLRFTFKNVNLYKGIDFIIFIMGVFGITELMYTICCPEDQGDILSFKFKELYPTAKDLTHVAPTILRGSLFGFAVGLIPGPGSMLATFGSYGLEKRLSKHPEEFGKGVPRGVAAPESANNASMYAQMVPLLSLGIPFSSSIALLMSAFMIHGITPGPMLITQHPDLFWGLIASMFIGNLFLIIINLPLVGIWASLLKVDFSLLMPIITIITYTGAFAINNSIFDLGIMTAAGLLGFWLKAGGYDLSALALGMFLGPTLEKNLISTLVIYDGSLFRMIASRPVGGTMLVIVLLVVVFMLGRTVYNVSKSRMQKRLKNEQTPTES